MTGMDVETELKIFTGKLFKNGMSQEKEFSIEDDVLYNYFVNDFTIGNEKGMYFYCRSKFDHNEWTEVLPKYVITIGFCEDDVEEIFFMESIFDVNGFLKEMQPLVDIAKHNEKIEAK